VDQRHDLWPDEQAHDGQVAVFHSQGVRFDPVGGRCPAELPNEIAVEIGVGEPQLVGAAQDLCKARQWDPAVEDADIGSPRFRDRLEDVGRERPTVPHAAIGSSLGQHLRPLGVYSVGLQVQGRPRHGKGCPRDVDAQALGACPNGRVLDRRAQADQAGTTVDVE